MKIKKTETTTKEIEIDITDGLHYFKIQTEDSDECSYYKVNLKPDSPFPNLTSADYTRVYISYDEVAITKGRDVSVYWKIEDWFMNERKETISITEFEEKYHFAKEQL